MYRVIIQTLDDKEIFNGVMQDNKFKTMIEDLKLSDLFSDKRILGVSKQVMVDKLPIFFTAIKLDLAEKDCSNIVVTDEDDLKTMFSLTYKYFNSLSTALKQCPNPKPYVVYKVTENNFCVLGKNNFEIYISDTSFKIRRLDEDVRVLYKLGIPNDVLSS